MQTRGQIIPQVPAFHRADRIEICNRMPCLHICIVYHWVKSMKYLRMTSWLVFVLFASDALAQIGYPGGGYPPGGRYPGGGIPGGGPGIPMPRRGKQSKTTTKEQDSQQLVTVTGMLRAVNDKQVVVEAPDHRIINLKRSEKTKFMKDGDDMKPSFFKPGDHLLIEANQDKEGFLFAVNVIFEKE